MAAKANKQNTKAYFMVLFKCGWVGEEEKMQARVSESESEKKRKKTKKRRTRKLK